jgi:hypothetical protein
MELPFTEINGRMGKKRGLIIIAGDMHEYKAFLEENGLPLDRNQYVFISDPTRLYGMQDVTILCVGNYRRSPVLNYKYLTREQTVRHIRLVDSEGYDVRA